MLPDPLWVFAYGSLLWNPGFEPAEICRAEVQGYHRSFSMLSIHHRGTPEQPGLVLALDAAKEARCSGLALRVAPEQVDQVVEALRARELVSAAYLERVIPLRLAQGQEIRALSYVIDPDHSQYVNYPLEQQARMIATAVGGRGPNPDYLFRTAEHLGQLGIEDTEMQWLVTRVRALIGQSARQETDG